MTAIGVDVGGSWLKLVVLADDGGVTLHDRRRLPPTGVVEFVTRAAAVAVERYSASSLGIGLAGLVDSAAGTLVWGPHLEGRQVPYRRLLEEALDMPVAVDNDANLAVAAEARLGAGQGADPVLLVALGTGIGVGLSYGNRVYRGRAFAGEAGHMQMTAEGAVCECGRSGCWETLVSGTVLDQQAQTHAQRQPDGMVARAAAGGPVTAEHLARAALAGDDAAADAYRRAGEWLGRGLVSLSLMVDPAIIIIGGAVSEAGDLLADPARRWLATELPGADHRPTIPVVPARFGTFAGAVGAALAGWAVQNGDDEW
ncbi:MAG: ROK family protein [Acidimicrobiia bacterium]